MTSEPDLEDPGQVFVHRAMGALKKEFYDSGDTQVPRLVVVIEMPPEGRIAIASTGDGAIDTHRILTLAAASVRHGMSKLTKQRARQYWDMIEGRL